jgi:hypothetical protein
MNRASQDGAGNSFFIDLPDLPQKTKLKTSEPLFTCVIRIASQGENKLRTKQLAETAIKNIVHCSRGKDNRLIPLSNSEYEYDQHLRNLHFRATNRTGMILNVNELSLFVHYPDVDLNNSSEDTIQVTKEVPSDFVQGDFYIGENNHNYHSTSVYLKSDHLIRHCHILGATGVGKSTLMVQMVLENIRSGFGCSVIDPHGDIIDDILSRIPENRKDDVIVFDPSDPHYSIGFNLFQAETDLEKIVLSSDLINAFRENSIAWGDNMTAVLSQGVNTFLEHKNSGTLLELKRFLLEEDFREEFLEGIDDPTIHYYWTNEYPMVKKSISPLITRIDTFLRPKIIRRIFAQKTGVSFSECLNQSKLLLVKLSQGLIGHENSYLLRTIILSKLNQVAKSRQNIARENRTPYFVYIDECHHFLSEGISDILSGARKYGLGLILAHQNLDQIKSKSMLSSILSNPFITLCFRLGYEDARRMSSYFLDFAEDDLQSLTKGQVIAQIGSKNNDFNLQTKALENLSSESDYIKEFIINNTQKKYAQPIEAVDEMIYKLLPRIKKTSNTKEVIKPKNQDLKEIEKPEVNKVQSRSVKTTKGDEFEIFNKIEEQEDESLFHKKKENYLIQAKAQKEITKHRSIQNMIRTLGMQYGFRSKEEAPTKDGGRIDVTLSNDSLRIAVEISVTNKSAYEVQNLEKCISEGFDIIFMISEDKEHLVEIEKLAKKSILKSKLKIIQFIQPQKFSEYLEVISNPVSKSKPKTIRGYRVKTSYNMDIDQGELDEKKSALNQIILNAIKNNKKGKES